MKYRGKFGYCKNSDLSINDPYTSGHYVYVRSEDKKSGKCKVSVCTSLDDNKGNIKLKRIYRVRNGDLYAIPKKNANFALWTGVYKEQKEVDSSKIQAIGTKKVRHKHLFGIGKL